MGQKADRREKMAAIRDRAYEVIRAPETHSLMNRERALDSLGWLWETDKGSKGSLPA